MRWGGPQGKFAVGLFLCAACTMGFPFQGLEPPSGTQQIYIVDEGGCGDREGRRGEAYVLNEPIVLRAALEAMRHLQPAPGLCACMGDEWGFYFVDSRGEVTHLAIDACGHFASHWMPGKLADVLLPGPSFRGRKVGYAYLLDVPHPVEPRQMVEEGRRESLLAFPDEASRDAILRQKDKELSPLRVTLGIRFDEEGIPLECQDEIIQMWYGEAVQLLSRWVESSGLTPSIAFNDWADKERGTGVSTSAEFHCTYYLRDASAFSRATARVPLPPSVHLVGQAGPDTRWSELPYTAVTLYPEPSSPRVLNQILRFFPSATKVTPICEREW